MASLPNLLGAENQMKVVWENESAKKGLPFDIGPQPGSGGPPPTMAAEEGERYAAIL